MKALFLACDHDAVSLCVKFLFLFFTLILKSFLQFLKIGMLDRMRVLEILGNYYDSSTEEIKMTLRNPRKCMFNIFECCVVFFVSLLFCFVVQTQTMAAYISVSPFILSGPIVDVEECEDYLLAEEQSREEVNKVSETPELKDDKPEISEKISEDIGEKAIFCDKLHLSILFR